MKFYIYQADVYCKDCGEQIKKELTEQGEAPENPEDFSTFDSDNFPKGPFPRRQNEADIPQHCADCGVFLENPLTDYGEDYVVRRIKEFLDTASEGNKKVIKEWLKYYATFYHKVAELKSDLIDEGVEIAE